MSIFNSKVDSESSQFIQNRDDMLNLIEKRKDILDRSRKKSDPSTILAMTSLIS